MFEIAVSVLGTVIGKEKIKYKRKEECVRERRERERERESI